MISLRQIHQVLNLSTPDDTIELDSLATGFAIDSRQVQKNNIFCAFIGERVDGHDYIPQALSKGASLIIASDRKTSVDPRIIIVPDVLQALQQLATFWRQQLTNTKIIALTGSNGKTTIKNLLHRILSEKAQCTATQSNQNNELGVPLTILSIPQTASYAIIELGARKLGDIAFLNNMTRPHIAFVSNIGHAHIGIFGSKQKLVEAKAEIFANLTPSEGTALIDTDSTYQKEFLQKIPRHTQIRRLRHQTIDFNNTNIDEIKPDNHARWDWQQQQSMFITPIGHIKIKLNLLGKHNAHNAAWAVLVAQHLGCTLTQIENGLSKTENTLGRLSITDYKPKQTPLKNLHLTILDDSYNANPESTQQALNVIRQFTGKKILILADMLELGNQSEDYHLKLTQPIIDSGTEKLFLLGKNCRHIHADLTHKNPPNLDSHWYPDLLQLQQNFLTYLTELAQTNQRQITLLVKGSNAMQLSHIIQTIKNL